jgi:MFS family permease
MRRTGDVRLAGLGVSLLGLSCFGLIVPSVALVLVSGIVLGLGIALAIVALTTAYQRRSPQHVQGRVSAAANMLFSVPQTVSIATGAALVTVLDYRVEIVIMAVVTLLASAYLLTRRGEDVVATEAAVA